MFLQYDASQCPTIQGNHNMIQLFEEFCSNAIQELDLVANCQFQPPRLTILGLTFNNLPKSTWRRGPMFMTPRHASKPLLTMHSPCILGGFHPIWVNHGRLDLSYKSRQFATNPGNLLRNLGHKAEARPFSR